MVNTLLIMTDSKTLQLIIYYHYAINQPAVLIIKM